MGFFYSLIFALSAIIMGTGANQLPTTEAVTTKDSTDSPTTRPGICPSDEVIRVPHECKIGFLNFKKFIVY